MHTPITSMLFGDDVAKEVKKCDTGFALAKENFAQIHRGFNRGRGARGGGPIRAHDFNQRARFRSHPYSSQNTYRYQYQNSNRGKRPAYTSLPNEPTN
jgi:hypothetical protein